MSTETIYGSDVEDLIDGRTPQLNLAVGGQQGAMASNFQWTSNAAYVKQKLIPVLVSAPKLMQYLPNSEEQVAALKSLIEVMAISITGLDSSLSWEFYETPVGNAGEQMESVTKGSRARSVPVFNWSEKYGMAITRFFTELGRQILSDPDTGFPGIVAEPKYIEAGSPPILPEQQSFTVLFIEPDETMTHVTNTWLSTNMMSKTAGEITGKREIATAAEVPEVSIEFTALTMTGSAVTSLGQNYLDSLKLEDLRPLDLKLYSVELSPDGEPLEDGITPAVAKAAEGFLSKSTVGDVGVMETNA